MRVNSSNTTLGATKRRALLFAALLLAAVCTLAIALESRAGADLQEKLDATQGKLEGVQAEQSELAASIAEQNAAIDSMIGEVSALRQKTAAAEAELAEKEEELDRATAALRKEREHLEVVRAQLKRALAVLSDRLVAIYESGSPDVVSTIIESSSWDEVAAQTEYLNRIQSYDDSVVERVKALRDEVTAAVKRLRENRAKVEEARDAVAEIAREAAAASAEAEARFNELRAAQAERRAAMDALESEAEALSSNLSSISNQIASETGSTGMPTAQVPPPLTPGERAHVINESEASAPAEAPQAVIDVISAANSIATTPYIWGGGHGSFESSGYDCSGAVSFALHGGGFLESPLDSTGLETWGEAGAGKWITVYANAEHAWMVVAGIAFDTVGGPGPRWHDPWVDSPEGFVARHPSGY
jgi:peptidoglycan hydrolase CwlO-like protein